jgi:hypothetical protein
MATKFYLSNISPLWPLSRQEAVIDAAYPGKRDDGNTWRDWLTPRARRTHLDEILDQRGYLVRPSTRKGGDNIVIASAAVLAWKTDALVGFLSAAAAKGSTIHIIDAKLTINPKSGPSVFEKVIAAFKKAKIRKTSLPSGRAGGSRSAELRSAEAEASCDTIKAPWSIPRGYKDYEPDHKLLKRAGVSRNTAKKYLGHRGKAQRIFISVQKRKSAVAERRAS